MWQPQTDPRSLVPSSEPPAGLAELQAAFGQAITTPFLIEPDSAMFQVQTETYPEAVVAQMIDQPERQLTGADRLGTYNRQYWFRLLSVLQEEYPLMVALLDYGPFNRLGMAYLEQHPPQHYSLRWLAERWVSFLQSQEPALDPMLIQTAQLEWFFIDAFDTAELPPLTPEDLAAVGEQLMTQPLVFQPYLRLFEEDWNLGYWRKQVKAHKCSEVTPIPQKGYWVLARPALNLTLVPLEPLAYHLLHRLWTGHSVEDALDWLCQELTEDEQTYLGDHLGTWFSDWTARGWIAKKGSLPTQDS